MNYEDCRDKSVRWVSEEISGATVVATNELGPPLVSIRVTINPAGLPRWSMGFSAAEWNEEEAEKSVRIAARRLLETKIAAARQESGESWKG